ncbi:MAG: DUF2330 domain-containing protein [Fimbriimonadaceae bacterium]
MRARTFWIGCLAPLTAHAFACCGVSPKGEVVKFLDQRNIIVWNAENKTEAFVRSARFKAKGKDFGFITPTPTVPKLEQVDPAAFETLEAAIKEHHDLFDNQLKGRGRGATAGAPGVEVVQIKKVGGYVATTVKAASASGLAEWMRENGYHTTRPIQNWTDFYIAKKWYLTAFKVDAEAGRAETGLVKLTFQTDVPFNPYYVPADNIPEAHEGTGLAIYFVADQVYDPTDARTALRTLEVVPISNVLKYKLRTQLKLGWVPKMPMLTLMADKGFPRESSDDVFFEPVVTTLFSSAYFAQLSSPVVRFDGGNL